MSLTLREAIDQVLTRIKLATGVDTQTYAEDQLKQIIQHKYNILFDAAWWPQFYNSGETFTLDGATGRVTETISAKIKRFQDIRYVWYSSYPDPLPVVNTRANPTTVQRWCYTADSTKVFKVMPALLTGSITVSYRTKPVDLVDDDDVIDMDSDLIVLSSAYDYLDSLGINNDEVQKLLSFFEKRLQTLMDQIETYEVSQGDYGYGAINGWQDVS